MAGDLGEQQLVGDSDSDPNSVVGVRLQRFHNAGQTVADTQSLGWMVATATSRAGKNRRRRVPAAN